MRNFLNFDVFIKLADYIHSIVPLSKEEQGLIQPFFTFQKVKKGTVLLNENQTCNFLAFICQGYFRIYINEEVKEVTVHLAGHNEFLSAFSSFINRKPNKENIQAITDAEILMIKYEDVQKLYSKSQKLERLGRLIVERHFVQKEQRVISLITDSAEQRYKNLLESRPDLLLNIPLQHIASYLGITPETLSRIRAK